MKEPAGFWIRLGASILDAIIVWIGTSILALIIYGTFFHAPEQFTDLISVLYAILVPFLWAGFTLGKRMLGIRIQKLDGSPPGFWRMVLRVVAGSLVYAITFGIGLIVSAIMVGVREDKRGIHDFIAGTQVVYD